jgi:hypothetical protein
MQLCIAVIVLGLIHKTEVAAEIAVASVADHAVALVATVDVHHQT